MSTTEQREVYVLTPGENGLEIVPCRGTVTPGRVVYASWKDAHTELLTFEQNDLDQLQSSAHVQRKRVDFVKRMQDPTL